jgi:hypothetical protein
MNNINPLHIAIALVVVLFLSLFKLSSLKNDLDDIQKEYKKSEKLAVEVSSIKSVYANKTKTRKAIDRILSQASLKPAKLDIKRTKDSINISSKSINSFALNSLMGKILNGSYNITMLKIKKIDKETASLQMEIKW